MVRFLRVGDTLMHGVSSNVEEAFTLWSKVALMSRTCCLLRVGSKEGHAACVRAVQE